MAHLCSLFFNKRHCFFFYRVAPLQLCKVEPPDSDEEVLERILKLPPQVCQNKQLCSIPEVTEEEDSSQEERLSARSRPRPRPGQAHPRDSSQYQQHQSNPHAQPYHHHYNRDPRSLTKEPVLRHGSAPVRPRTQHRVHYADTVDTISYPEEEGSLYEGPASRRVPPARCPPQPAPHNSKERVLLRGLGDRLRREAMLRSQKAAATAAHCGYGPPPPRPRPLGRAARTLRTPTVCGGEIDVEYGAEDDVGEVPAEYGPGEGADQPSGEWWVEGALADHHRPHRRAMKPEQLVNTGGGQVNLCLSRPPRPLPVPSSLRLSLFPVILVDPLNPVEEPVSPQEPPSPKQLCLLPGCSSRGPSACPFPEEMQANEVYLLMVALHMSLPL